MGHLGLRLIAVTENYLVKFFRTRLTVDEHFEAPSCIVLSTYRTFDGSIEYKILEEIKVPRIRLYILLKLST
jgi:hypothetical protein